MCTTDVYTRVRSDGSRPVQRQTLPCPSFRPGMTCPNQIEVQHTASNSTRPRPPPRAQQPSYYIPPTPAPGFVYPPTPAYSPRLSSHDSGSGSDRRSRHSPALPTSRRGHLSPDLSARSHHVPRAYDGEGHSSSSCSTGRKDSRRRHTTILMPRDRPVSRTVHTYTLRPTAPPSPLPSLSSASHSSPTPESYGRPRAVYERPRAVYERPRTHLRNSYVRPPSPPPQRSHRSEYPSSVAATVGDHAESNTARKEQHVRRKIEKDNAEIASRPPVSGSGGGSGGKNKNRYTERRSRRDSGGYDQIVTAMSNASINEKRRQEARAYDKAVRLEKEELEAQDARLRERLTPLRPTTTRQERGRASGDRSYHYYSH